MRIGFVGAGIMGAPIVGHLMKAGHEVVVYARHPERVAVPKEILVSSLEQAFDVDVFMTMLGFPSDVKSVYERLIESDYRPLCVDLTTSSPDLAVELAKSLSILDAPVTGGDVGAQRGQLTVLVGGDRALFEKLTPLFECFGQHIYYCGPSGSGQSVKAANQIMIANTLQGIGEAMAYLEASGLDKRLLVDFLKDGAAGSSQLSLQGQKVIDGDMSPGFYVKHFLKDLRIALERLDLAGVKRVIEEYESLDVNEEGTQSLVKYFVEV